MQSPYLQLCKTFSTNSTCQFAFRHCLSSQAPFTSPSSVALEPANLNRKLVVRSVRRRNGAKAGTIKVRGNKDNMWSIDNEMAEKEQERSKQQRRWRGRRVVRGKRTRNGPVKVSGAMLIEVETVLQTQEPVIQPAWHTFASSVSGIWKGVGAVFSPITAEMEPIEIGSKNEHLYDCYTMSRIQALSNPTGGQASQIQRKINWVTLNPYGEVRNSKGSIGGASPSVKDTVNESAAKHNLQKFDSFDFGASDVMEEDVMGPEPGLVFFEDGSYSRGPVDIPVGEVDESNYYLSPTFKFEQCLVQGCHKRLRIVHTVEFSNGGSEIQIMRVAVYEEEWASPANIQDESDMEFDAMPLSQRRRTQPSDLTGSWKVFEVSATPIYGEEEEMLREETNSTPPYVYLCTETLKKRSLPENFVYFGEEEMVDMKEATILWLPGGITGYVDINKDGTLCFGVGWYSDEGINLVMERDYGLDGKLKEVRWKSEVKRRWSSAM